MDAVLGLGEGRRLLAARSEETPQVCALTQPVGFLIWLSDTVALVVRGCQQNSH